MDGLTQFELVEWMAGWMDGRTDRLASWMDRLVLLEGTDLKK